MNAQTAFIMRQAFAALYNRAKQDRHRSLRAEFSMLWLQDEGWPALFPGHCFRCHGFGDGPCHTHGGGMRSCPGCVKEEQEHRQTVKQAMMEPITPGQVLNLMADQVELSDMEQRLTLALDDPSGARDGNCHACQAAPCVCG